MTITPVLLCGGSGTRLWPLSRKSYPKQFVPLMGQESLFQGSARRLTGPHYNPPVVVTSDAFRFIVTEQLSAVDIPPAAILIEPEARDTAPAILAAALFLAESDPDGLMLVAPSDHVIPDAATFNAAVAAGLDRALDPIRRAFLYLPYMHSESALMHALAVRLFAVPGMENNLDFELRHQAIIECFGRYPHRNAVLGRPSTAAEIEFLKTPGSAF